MKTNESYIKDETGYCEAQLRDALKLIDNFNTTTAHKREHKDFVMFKLKDLINKQLWYINPYLFEADFNYYFKQYEFNVHCNSTKKELDKWLKLTLNDCRRLVWSIIHDFY